MALFWGRSGCALCVFDDIPLKGFGCCCGGGCAATAPTSTPEPARKATASGLPRRRLESCAVFVLALPLGVGRWPADVVLRSHKLRRPNTAFSRPQPGGFLSGELSPISFVFSTFHVLFQSKLNDGLNLRKDRSDEKFIVGIMIIHVVNLPLLGNQETYLMNPRSHIGES